MTLTYQCWVPGPGKCESAASLLPCIVLDPFAGSGTTGLVARQEGRRAILIDLSAKYLDLARHRLAVQTPRMAGL